ncbi:MAG: carbohydrate kinase family protein [Archaeoglobi archaeon]|nr:carbohydrate kinase family protein [Candidatus Mnemosynella sp.]
MKFDVICFGALNLDRIYRVDRIAREDEESRILDFLEAPGGSAANTAVALSRLGCSVGFIGKVASDREGRTLLESMEREGLHISEILISERGRSGIALSFVDSAGQRALYVSPGVNDDISFEELNLEYAQKTRFLHLSSFAGEKSFEAQKRLVESLGEVKVTLDPGMLYARRGLESLRPILRRCYVFLPSRAEIEILTGEDYIKGAEIVREEGVKIVAVKLGEMGCYVTDGRHSFHLPAYKVRVVDTTGAGDAFSAGFIYGLLRGKDLKECAILGNFLASRVVQGFGARANLPEERELPV